MADIIPITRIVCKARDLEDQLRLSLWWLSDEGEAWRREVHADIDRLTGHYEPAGYEDWNREESTRR